MGGNQSRVDGSGNFKSSNTSTTVVAETSSKADSSDSKCPVQKKGGRYSFGGIRSNFAAGDGNEKSECPVKARHDDTTSESKCPVKGKTQIEYNVYSQPIDPKNNMPSVANQLPGPNQEDTLTTERVKSTIPKGGANDGDTWTYPSPQMFYNSLVRKSKVGDTEESEIESVVKIHNNMNEKTWSKVMEWEQVLDPEGDAKLLKFMGRPSDLSPKARLKNVLFGNPLPFDRHDWTIVRADGNEVRYVIDYYYDESNAKTTPESALPDMHDRDAVQSILVDVRPAVDSIHNTFGRICKMPYARHLGKNTTYVPLPLIPSEELKKQVGESEKVWEDIQNSVQNAGKEAVAKNMTLKEDDIAAVEEEISYSDAKDIAKSITKMLQNCKDAQKNVQVCDSDAECAEASIALNMCVAEIVCPLQHDVITKAINTTDPDDKQSEEMYNTRVELALENMVTCVQTKGKLAATAKRAHPDLFKGL